MTCREKFYEMNEHAGYDHRDFCPRDCGFLPNPEYCKEGADEEVVCEQCWDREILEKQEKKTLDDLLKTCAPNYEAMYNEQLGLSQDLLKKNKELKTEVRVLEHKLACAKGAIAMVEVIYGRQWKPSCLEMIR